MSNKQSNQPSSNWIDIDITKLTDRSLHQLLVQSDGLALDKQFALEVGIDIPAGSAGNTTPPSTLRIREISDATDEYGTTTSTATRSRPLITTWGRSHPGLQFLTRVSRVAILTVTTEVGTTGSVKIKPPTGETIQSQFKHTAAGAVGAALEYLPTQATQDLYVQLVIMPGSDAGGTTQFESSDPDSVEDYEIDQSQTFTVGISILVGSPSTGTATISHEALQKEAMRTAKTYFTPPNSEATFTYAWRHSTPPGEFIERPRLQPDATRYRWLSRHLGLAPINSGVQTVAKKVGFPRRRVHEQLPLIREFLGTPAKIRVNEAGLRWLFGGQPANHHTRNR